MEDQDRETRIDEDVEGHMNKGSVNKGRNIAKDDDEDVEGHMHLNAVNKGMHKN